MRPKIMYSGAKYNHAVLVGAFGGLFGSFQAIWSPVGGPIARYWSCFFCPKWPESHKIRYKTMNMTYEHSISVGVIRCHFGQKQG